MAALKHDEAIRVSVAGRPASKGRARNNPFVKSARPYTPEKTRSWQAKVGAMVQDIMNGRPPISGPVRLDVRACFRPSDSWPGWKRELALSGKMLHTTKPDMDNITKIIKDSCNGVVWIDDSYVSIGTQVKVYGEVDCTVFTITPIDALPCQVKKKSEAGLV